MLDPEREVEMELEGDSKEVSGSPTTRSPSQFMDYEMFCSLSPLDPSFDYSVSLWNSPSPGGRPQSPEFEISLWNFPSPSRWPSPEPGFSRLISSHGNASSSTQPPVRSPSPPFREQATASSVQQKYQVFLSFRGEDTRNNFTSHLYCALEQMGIDCFRDDQLKRGEVISLSLMTAIEESTISIIILSENYASSSWCLEELSKILECKETKGQIVVPIFYDVDPSDLHNQKGKSFENAFAKHQEQFKDRTGKVEKWRAAFKEVCNLSGTHIYGKLDYSKYKVESQYIHEICEYVASYSARSPPGPNGLPDGEEVLHQDSLKHQLVGETHAMNDGENVLSDGGIHSAVSYPENEGTRKTPKRKITIKDLQHFSGSRNDAANHFGVSVPTIKRCLRDHKIKDWRNRNMDKNNQCLSEPEEIIESFPGEGAEMGNQMAGCSRSCERELNHGQIGSDRSQIGVGLMEESSTRLETNPTGNMFASSAHEQFIEAGDHSELPIKPSKLNLFAPRLRPDVVNITLPQTPEGELLIGYNISATEAFNTEQVLESCQTNLLCSISNPETESTGKTRKRKTTLEGLQHFSDSRKDPAKHFGASKSTIKRHCRDYGIKWQDRKIEKNNRSLSKPKDMIEYVQGEEAEMGDQMAGGCRPCERELNREQIGFPPESENGFDKSQIGVGPMEDISTQVEITLVGDMFVSSTHEQSIESGDYSEFPVQPSESNQSAARLWPDAVNSTLPQIPVGELLIENSRSSREISDCYISATKAFNAKHVPDASGANLSCSDMAPKLATGTAARMMSLVTETQDRRTVTMKATYRQEMIRFQLPLTSGIIELRKEVAERLMLEVGTFSIKYLDDDEDWISMTVDKDLQECFKISVSLGRNVIKLSIHDVTPS